jgi:NAD(P)-dependent dehydrogenase (short-subunit alcohol dehydrogenase family)
VLGAAGARVVATARRTGRLDALKQADPKIVTIQCDLSRPDERVRLIAEARTAGPITVLVNNAGVGGSHDPEPEGLDQFSRILDINLAAAYDLACQVAACVRDGATASIINVASILGLVSGAPFGSAAYSASKAGLIGLTRELAAQWGARGIRVNALAPGWFPSDMTDHLFRDEQFNRWIARNTLVRRAGESGELDGAILYLASRASSYVTGQVLAVDGGWTAR